MKTGTETETRTNEYICFYLRYVYMKSDMENDIEIGCD